jgi:hypothetical protein
MGQHLPGQMSRHGRKQSTTEPVLVIDKMLAMATSAAMRGDDPVATCALVSETIRSIMEVPKNPTGPLLRLLTLAASTFVELGRDQAAKNSL